MIDALNTHAAVDADLHPFLKSRLGHAIGGRVVESASGKVFASLNPATGKVLCHLAEGDATDVDKAVKAARAAFEGPWSKWTQYERHTLLMPTSAWGCVESNACASSMHRSCRT